MNWNEGEAEAEGEAAIPRGESAPVRRTAVPREVVLTATTAHAVRAIGIAIRTGKFSTGIMGFILPIIQAPFGNIAAHIEQTKLIGSFLTDFIRCAI